MISLAALDKGEALAAIRRAQAVVTSYTLPDVYAANDDLAWFTVGDRVFDFCIRRDVLQEIARETAVRDERGLLTDWIDLDK
jgi:hypothetical protein